MPASFGVHGPGESTIASGSARDDGRAGDLVVAVHADLGAQFTEIVHQVEGETVVIVDQDDHARTSFGRRPKIARCALPGATSRVQPNSPKGGIFVTDSKGFGNGAKIPCEDAARRDGGARG